MGDGRIVKVESREGCQMDVGKLRERVRRDWERFREGEAGAVRPLVVVSAGGCTSLGVVDDLQGVGEVCREFGMWHHCDACYGGFFGLLTDEGKEKFGDMRDSVDSIAIDPHKGLFMSHGTGMIIVRYYMKLYNSFFYTSAYMCDVSSLWEKPDFCCYGVELTRENRGLPIFFTMKLVGIDNYREALTEKLELAKFLKQELSKIEEIELFPHTDLSVVCWRNPTWDNEKNSQWMTQIQSRNTSFITGTTVKEIFYLRCCISSLRTHKNHVEDLISEIRLTLEISIF